MLFVSWFRIIFCFILTHSLLIYIFTYFHVLRSIIQIYILDHYHTSQNIGHFCNLNTHLISSGLHKVCWMENINIKLSKFMELFHYIINISNVICFTKYRIFNYSFIIKNLQKLQDCYYYYGLLQFCLLSNYV